MYRAGQIRPDIERFAEGDALEAYRRLEAGELSGRAVDTSRLVDLVSKAGHFESV